jgi:hypothetical protein
MAHSIIQQPDPKFDLLFEPGKQWPVPSPVGCLVDRQELGNKQSLRDACGQRLGFWHT